MSRPRPKFCVGEEVSVKCFGQPDIDRTEIVAMTFFGFSIFNDTGPYSGWAYKVADQVDPNSWAIEPAVSKLPPEGRASWGCCVWRPADKEREAA